MSIVPSGPFRAFRGGSWWLVAQVARAAYRNARGPSARDGSLGLRLMRRAA